MNAESHKKTVVVGLGMGRQHTKLISTARGLQLYGACDVVPEKLEEAKAEYPHLKLYKRYERVLADPEVDLVVLVVPHNAHAPMAIAAMEAGKHVVLDKPLCLSVQEARALIKARDKTGRMLTISHNRRWDQDFLTVKRAVESGLIGKILHFETNNTWYGTPIGWRIKRKAIGGWLFNWGAHLLDQACLLIKSKPRNVFAVDHYNPAYKQEVEDFIRALVIFEDGTSLSITVSQMCRLPMTRFFVVGSEGTLSYRGRGPCEVRREMNGVSTTLQLDAVKGDWQEFYHNVGDVLNNRGKLLITAEQCLPMISIAQAGHLSAAKGRLLEISEVSRGR